MALGKSGKVAMCVEYCELHGARWSVVIFVKLKTMKNKSGGLFDEQFWLEKISKQNDLLEKLLKHVDFEFFRKPLED